MSPIGSYRGKNISGSAVLTYLVQKEASNPDTIQQNTLATISIAGINPYSKSIR